ncbi:glycosyltransferase family 4 protein [Leptolyngbya boryana CZ1]|uniref:Glycosyltransferase family 4 protein n=1 Tax=Leptolyngbya boryana CZ1 TaxID=3060204 RepID=A0AA96WTP9_LEPBY|nr:glycosyltransferase family 4 protein [Leptolyngbya boryana]WNZ43999.1 glycosyltransferase family 4 protein [Leptolyngbya boryana CZ1]
MNVLHINTWGGVGGAFIAANRLHTGLIRAGASSTFAYGHAFNGSDTALRGLAEYQKLSDRNHRLQRSLTKLTKRLGLNDVSSLASFSLLKSELFENATILNFHNLHSDFFSYLALPKLTVKPTVWTLHDMWAFTGHCAYSYDCSKWLTGCGHCPYLSEQPSVQRDATALEWKLKNWVYEHSNLTIVAPSRWLVEQAKQGLLSRFDVHHIPNGIDTEAYLSLDREHCRSVLGIEHDRKVLLFVAQSLKDMRKGGDLLLKALQNMPAALKSETLLLTLGEGGENIAQQVGMETLNLGYVNHDRLKSIAYSAADLFVFPTRADNLPLVLQESLACGTPIVSFKVGGVPDMVRPGITGYLAQPEDAEDLKNGIVQLLDDPELRSQMRKNARAIALSEYTLDHQAQRYLELYQSILK